MLPSPDPSQISAQPPPEPIWTLNSLNVFAHYFVLFHIDIPILDLLLKPQVVARYPPKASGPEKGLLNQ